MLVNGVKTAVLYLEDWQKKMIKDFLKIDCDTYTVSLGGGPNPVHTRYGILTDEKLKRMYLTDWQIRELKEEIGDMCDYIELHKDIVSALYMPPPVK
jgi:hypothetical protein